ncbi:unnamed protein product [Rotaria magnacalcarata]|nr:unnamed protein product [Rotaria magnacalcarata]
MSCYISRVLYRLLNNDWQSIGAIIASGETFLPRRTYFERKAPDWFDDLEEKAKTSDMHNGSMPPLEQRRAWMAVIKVIMNQHGMNDFPSYDTRC